MPVTEVLSHGVVQLGLDDVKLRDALEGIVVSTRGAARNVETSFVKSVARGASNAALMQRQMQALYKTTGDLQYLNANSIRMREAEVRTTQKLTQETQKYGAIRKQLGLDSGERVDATQGINRASTSVLGAIGTTTLGVSGATFAAAAAAGSTTLDTLTGSIRMLTLAAGAKTQQSVLKISDLIQQLAHQTDKLPSGGATVLGAGAVGAGIGGRIAGAPGALAGAGLGILGGGALEDAAQRDAFTKQLAGKMASDRDKYVPSALKAIRDLEAKADTMVNPFQFKDKKDTLNTIEMIKNALAMIDGVGAKNQFKTAGLGFPGSYSGLSDIRQQAQMSVFTSGGPLGQDNMIREMKLNTDAIQANTAAMKGGADSGNAPAFVGPPNPN